MCTPAWYFHITGLSRFQKNLNQECMVMEVIPLPALIPARASVPPNSKSSNLLV